MKLICKARGLHMERYSQKDVIAIWEVNRHEKRSFISIKIDFDGHKGQVELVVDDFFLKKAVMLANELYGAGEIKSLCSGESEAARRAGFG